MKVVRIEKSRNGSISLQIFSIFSSNKNPPSTKYSKLESAEAEAEAAPPFEMMEDLEADTLDQVSII